MDVDGWAAVAAALVSGSAATGAIGWWKDRKKDAAEAEVTSVSALTAALVALRAELEATHAEVSRLRDENRELVAEVRRLEARIDRPT